MEFGPDFWNSPLVSSIAFVPRRTERTGGDNEGDFQVDGATLGWRLYPRADAASSPGAPVLLYAHANAETAADVQLMAPFFHAAGFCAVLAWDYRGFGFSTGQPSVGTLLPDMERVAATLPALLEGKALANRPLVMYGRSLGAACAVHIVSLAPVRRARQRRCPRGTAARA